jgi:hypothetical protein
MSMNEAPKSRAARAMTLDEKTILAWSDAFYIEHGKLPLASSGPIPQANDITWRAVDLSLRTGRRGLAAGGSLARLLERERDKHIYKNRTPLTVDRILTLADSYYFLHGVYPVRTSGWASLHLGETWAGIDIALREGRRGLPGHGSLSRLLEERRGVRNKQNLPPFTTEQILAWGDAYYARHGEYPKPSAGSVPESPGDTWKTVQSAMFKGHRGLPGGSTLNQLFSSARGVRNVRTMPRLTSDLILSWADAHYRRHNAYPNIKSGPVGDAPEETWYRIHESLRLGLRGLPGRSSLLKLLMASGRLSRRGQPASTAPSR